jgi:2-oxoglutarate dehydrogenase E2 component (dihydrolipoamide succinyltransferase)
MAVEIKVTPAGESVTHATLLAWKKPDGAIVKAGEAICELETDKATKEEYAPISGVLQAKTQPGTKVAIGAVIGFIDPAGVPRATPVTPPPTAATPAPQPVPPVATPTRPTLPASDPEVRLSPAARPLVEAHGLDVSQIPSSSRGVVTKSDVLNFLETHSTPTPAVAPSSPPAVAAPAVQPQPPVASRGGERRVKMSPVRQRIAERLLAAQSNAAILTTFNEADLSRVIELRTRYKDTFQKKHGVGLGFMSFFVKAAVEALKAYPAVNAFIDGEDIVYHDYYHIGVAVSTDKGLMVPVLRDCDQLSCAAIEKAIVDLANRAREGKISVADLQGGTFTITNGGIFGSMLSTPILNPPQSGILGMHAIQKRAVVVDDQIVIRPMMYLALSYDHRIIDGKEAVSFLVRIKECIENPERLLLEV